MRHQGLKTEALTLLEDIEARFPVRAPVAIEWRRYRTTAGMAHCDRVAISLSMIVITDSERLRETLLHEYAHLLAFHRHGRCGIGHGRPWRNAMADLGAVPVIYHSYDCVRNVARQHVRYQCCRCATILQRRRRFPKRHRYLHRGCGGEFVFVSVVQLEDPEAA